MHLCNITHIASRADKTSRRILEIVLKDAENKQ